ncbi:hypothetical protein F3Y22_tig00111099pilonHSYRG00216 [Hibiscus syriacus]|uniref:RNase H type-1 domain-containing protein n=1 Tax=Hibiscus syriacus TaxID=106335 RepID=A0A6A2Z2M2_HIBSY|nr:hypothetical protein F3Y22_tig00111099pilonHSYRG00216 [Hibiscus syriacus]
MLHDLGPLIQYYNPTEAVPPRGTPVIAMTTRGGEWDWAQIWNHVPEKVRSSLATIRMHINSGSATVPWDVTNGYRGLPRIKMLLWIICKGRLLSNKERARCHLMSDASCLLCDAARESGSQLLRECPLVREPWKVLINPERWDEFTRMELVAWIDKNIRQPEYFPITTTDWDIHFGVMIWCIWTRRNQVNFYKETTAFEGITPRNTRIKEEITRALHNRVVRQRVQERPGVGGISWEAPPTDWVKLNTDGGWRSDSGWATCGGVFRNSDADWILGFSQKIGCCTVVDVELWGIFSGLTIAWNHGFRKVIVESDCMDVVAVLQGNKRMESHLWCLVLEIFFDAIGRFKLGMLPGDAIGLRMEWRVWPGTWKKTS